MRKEKPMKYQRKTKEFVEAIKYTKDCPIEGVLDFVKNRTDRKVEIGGILITKLKDCSDQYRYSFQTSEKIGLIPFYDGDHIVKTENNEIEIYRKDSFAENFTTPWEYE